MKANEGPFPGGISSGATLGAEMLAEGSTRQVVSDMSRFVSKTKAQHEAADDERMRLARDLQKVPSPQVGALSKLGAGNNTPIRQPLANA